ncbi:MAG TPA: phosphoglyceromutase, partial [Firmicutes bacterium]|nr:phosphoglyceromutase [Bacillota bacterium]
LMAFLLILPLLFKRPPHVLAQIFRKRPMLRKGFIGAVLASIIALIVNDSGVVAAATCMILAGIGLIDLVLIEVYAPDSVGAQQPKTAKSC